MNRTWLVGGAFLALVAGPALADENSGLYLGAGMGDFSSEINDVEDVDIDFDEDSDASKFFGGWRFNRFFALQVDYVEFGESRATFDLLDIESDAKGLAPNLVATLPLGPVELFAKAGVLFYNVEINTDGETFIDESGEDAVYGAGLGVTLLERLALRAEYEVVDISEFEDAEAVWLSAAWRF